jgi:hypothetical protein
MNRRSNPPMTDQTTWTAVPEQPTPASGDTPSFQPVGRPWRYEFPRRTSAPLPELMEPQTVEVPGSGSSGWTEVPPAEGHSAPAEPTG